MIVKSEEKLFEYVKHIYELNYNHYTWAKQEDLDGCFPNWCCGSSSRNVFLNSMDKGYPNASIVYNDSQDHTYLAFPFLFGEAQKKGFIVADPTSDQLFNNESIAPRNNIFISPGINWVYKTDWQGGTNLYPSKKDDSEFANLHTLRRDTGDSVKTSGKIGKYFQKVFENPVKINIKKLN